MAGTRQLRILVDDDDDAFARYLTRAMEREPDLEVVGCASSVGEAAALVHRTVPDVVLTDYRLPDGTGAGLARRVCSAGSDLRVIVLTAGPTSSVRHDVAAARACALIDKIVRPARLAQIIRDAADGASPVRS